MRFFQLLIQFFAYSNIWIGLGAATFTCQFYFITKNDINYWIVIFAFFSTLLTYTFQRYVKIIQDRYPPSNRFIWMIKNKTFVKASMVISSFGATYALFKMNSILITTLFLFFMGFLSFFYVVKLPGKFNRNLRDIPSLKIFLIALVWSMMSCIIPYINLESPNHFPVELFFFAFIVILGLTIPFDIRDIDFDEDQKKTIPQILGERNSVYLAISLLVIGQIGLFILLSQVLFFSSIGLVLTIALIRGALRTKHDLYFSFFVDGLLILQPTLLFFDLVY